VSFCAKTQTDATNKLDSKQKNLYMPFIVSPY
jgi:hypothetical protein